MNFLKMSCIYIFKMFLSPKHSCFLKILFSNVFWISLVWTPFLFKRKQKSRWGGFSSPLPPSAWLFCIILCSIPSPTPNSKDMTPFEKQFCFLLKGAALPDGGYGIQLSLAQPPAGVCLAQLIAVSTTTRVCVWLRHSSAVMFSQLALTSYLPNEWIFVSLA